MLRSPIRALRVLSDWRLWALGFGVAIGLAIFEARDAWSPDGGHQRAVVKLALYWGLWLVWPLLARLALRVFAQLRRGRPLRAVFALAVLAGALLWSRFVEPQQLRVIETSIGTTCGARVALVSDLHVGLYVREEQLERLVRHLNALDVDAVLVAGDWTYEPPRELRAAFAPLGLVNAPIYGVLGNHEEQLPGAPLKEPLMRALESLNVHWIEGKRVPLGRCELAGLGDLEAGGAVRDLVLLAKTPWHDTLYDLEPRGAALLLAGHTHGGQIDLPWLTDALLRAISRGGFKRGLYAEERVPVFVTSGIGMARLPLRFRMPPTIDVLAL